MQTVESRAFETLTPGESASWERTLQLRDLIAWRSAFGDTAVTAGDVPADAAAGLLSSSFAALVGARLPGPGSHILSLAVQPTGVLPLDQPILLTLTVREQKPASRSVILDARATGPGGEVLAHGAVEAVPPAAPTQALRAEHRLDWLLEKAQALPPMRTGIVHPLSKDALAGAVEAASAGLIEPILYGPKAALQTLARQSGLDISAYELVDTHSEADSAGQAAHAAGAGKLQALMKGSLHTDVLLHAVMEADAGLRTGQLLSHVALISSPAYGRRFVVTDVALNIAPTLDQKRDIAQNAIGLLHALEVSEPKVAVIAAVEVVNSRMQATLDGAVLAKMADRGQIVGGIVDGPLDLDAAVDAGAAQIKKIVSPVAGQADILLVPNIETGNAVYKTLGFTADAQTAGLVVGARVPVILTSRADTAAIRRFSAALAVLYANALAQERVATGAAA